MRQLWIDPVLRQWIFGCVLGRWSFVANQDRSFPPYLDKIPAPVNELTQLEADEIKPDVGRQAIALELPGETIFVDPGAEDAIFSRRFEVPDFF